jgi:hypothetical protein
MADPKLQYLWLLSEKGQEIFYYSSDPSSITKSPLISNFFTGLHTFLNNFGGGRFYNLVVQNGIIIGIKITITDGDSIYLIGQFLTNLEKQGQRCEKILRDVERKIRDIQSRAEDFFAIVAKKLGEYLNHKK